MVTTSKGPTKTSFLHDLFQRNPDATPEDASDAWSSAGHEGEINTNTFYNYKSSFNKKSAGGGSSGEAAAVKARPKKSAKGTKPKKTSKRVEQPEAQANGRHATSEPTARREAAHSGNHDRVLDEIEDSIDDLIHRLKTIGAKSEIVEALRRARRLLYQGQK